MWNDEARVCDHCFEPITTGYINPLADLHFHNTHDKPCFWKWLMTHLESAVKPKEKKR